MAHLFGVAKEKGISDEEIGAVQAIVMAGCGGRIRYQIMDVFGGEVTQPG